LSIHLQEASRTQNRLDQKTPSSWPIISKTISTENRERILKAVREERQIIYKGKPMNITADLSTETLNQERHGVRYFKH
jgi:hypothetical protein